MQNLTKDVLTTKITKATNGSDVFDYKLSYYIVERFRRLRKFSSRSIITDAPFHKRLSHQEGREGHEDRIGKGIESEKNVFFLRALRVLRGRNSCYLVAPMPRELLRGGIFFLTYLRLRTKSLLSEPYSHRTSCTRTRVLSGSSISL